jgi:hypothetical protein
MALWNVIRLKGHRIHIIWGKAVDVLTHDEWSGEPAIKRSPPYTRTRSGGDRRERDFVIDVKERRGSSASSGAQLGASSSFYKIK